MQTVLEAISGPIRRQILNILKSGEKSAGELGSKFDISGPSISQYLYHTTYIAPPKKSYGGV
jgi:ArsR family transcriptional regulator